MKTPNRKKTPSKEKKAKKPTVDEMVALEVSEKEREVREKEAYVAFVRWDILTVKERLEEKLPDTQEQFAKKWDIRPATISAWKDRKDFAKHRSDMFRKKLAAEIPEVMGDLRKRIKKYGVGLDVELWLAYAEGWDRKKVVEIKPTNDFGEGDVRALIAKLPREKQKTYYATIAKLIADATAADDEL